MASVVLSGVRGSLGTGLGNFVGSMLGNELVPGVGGKVFGSWGRQLGNRLDSELGLGNTPTVDAPLLEGLKVQDSRYGVGIPTLFGRTRVAGNVIWASDLTETRTHESTPGGKGGGSIFSASRTVVRASLHCAVALGLGPIGGLETVWADSKVIYQNGRWTSGVAASVTVHTGTDTQEPDPLLQAWLGADSVPAYKGLAYLVLESLQLSTFGNRLPNLTFEVLPPATSPTPRFLGTTSTGSVKQQTAALRDGAMGPIVLTGSSTKARTVLVGGTTGSGASTTLAAVTYDVTGTTPVEVARATSATFTVSSVGDHAWALSPEGRFVAGYVQDVSGTPTHRLGLYDTESQTFGPVLALDLPFTASFKQIAWLDSTHVVLMDAANGIRGIRLLARAGAGLVDMGFVNVWGAGSQVTRMPFYHAQFWPLAEGVMALAAQVSGRLVTLYGRPLSWSPQGLVVGAEVLLAGPFDVGTGSGGQARLLATGEDEVTLVYGTVVDLRLVSIHLTRTSASVTRPWQILVPTAFSVGTSSPPMALGDRLVLAQRSASDNLYRVTEVHLDEGAFSLVADGVPVSDFALPLMNFDAVPVEGSRFLLTGTSGFYGTMTQVALIRRRETGTTVAKATEAILTRAGYAANDMDLSALESIPLDGYALGDPLPAASALAPLQAYASFDLVDSEGQLKAVRHGTAPTITLAAEEEGASAEPLPSEPTPTRTVTRLNDQDLPSEVTVDYLDAARDYEVGSQRARRLTLAEGARSLATLRLPLVCAASVAKRVAETRLFTAWAERERVRVTLSRRWAMLEAGDTVDLGDRWMRILHLRHDQGLITAEGTLTPPAVSGLQDLTLGAAEEGGLLARVVPRSPATVAALMDLPLLRAEDDQAGVYAALSGPSGWTGGSLWVSRDSGVTFTRLAGFDSPATMGFTVSVLPTSNADVADRASTLDVQLMNGTLAGCTESEWLGGANVALVGDEILQFQTATLLGPGLYRLAGFLRGRRGTEGAIGTHATGERFVLLTPESVQLLPLQMTDRDKTLLVRALSDGQTLGEAADLPLTSTLATLRPLAPAHVMGTRSGGTGTDLTLTWKRRARLNGLWLNEVDVPLDEPTEVYDVDVMNGATVKRTFASVTTPSQVYTAAQQTADWGGTIPPTFTVRVFQRSARYGHGQGAEAVV